MAGQSCTQACLQVADPHGGDRGDGGGDGGCDAVDIPISTRLRWVGILLRHVCLLLLLLSLFLSCGNYALLPCDGGLELERHRAWGRDRGVRAARWGMVSQAGETGNKCKSHFRLDRKAGVLQG